MVVVIGVYDPDEELVERIRQVLAEHPGDSYVAYQYHDPQGDMNAPYP